MDAQPPEEPKPLPISKQRNPLAEENLPKRREPWTTRDLRSLCALAAIALFVIAGVKLLQIHSESGDSIAEAFYHAFAFLAFGLAALSAVVGIRL